MIGWVAANKQCTLVLERRKWTEFLGYRILCLRPYRCLCTHRLFGMLPVVSDKEFQSPCLGILHAWCIWYFIEKIIVIIYLFICCCRILVKTQRRIECRLFSTICLQSASSTRYLLQVGRPADDTRATRHSNYWDANTGLPTNCWAYTWMMR